MAVILIIIFHTALVYASFIVVIFSYLRITFIPLKYDKSDIFLSKSSPISMQQRQAAFGRNMIFIIFVFLCCVALHSSNAFVNNVLSSKCVDTHIILLYMWQIDAKLDSVAMHALEMMLVSLIFETIISAMSLLGSFWSFFANHSLQIEKKHVDFNACWKYFNVCTYFLLPRVSLEKDVMSFESGWNLERMSKWDEIENVNAWFYALWHDAMKRKHVFLVLRHFSEIHISRSCYEVIW